MEFICIILHADLHKMTLYCLLYVMMHEQYVTFGEKQNESNSFTQNMEEPEVTEAATVFKVFNCDRIIVCDIFIL